MPVTASSGSFFIQPWPAGNAGALFEVAMGETCLGGLSKSR